MPDVKAFKPHLKARFVAEIERAMARHGLLKNALFIGDVGIIESFTGKSKIAWRDLLDVARTRPRATQNPGHDYFIFNHGAHFNQREVDGFHAMGLHIVVSVNVLHYPDHDQDLEKGKKHIEQALDLGVDGLQIDSEYGEFAFRLVRQARG